MYARVIPQGLGMTVRLKIAGEKARERDLLRCKTVGILDGVPEGGVVFFLACMVLLSFWGEVVGVFDVWESSKDFSLQYPFFKNALSL